MEKALKIRVVGKVQGVWFRKYTKEKADELALKGFVRNEIDGSVYIEIAGDRSAVDDFLDWCWTGSPKSEVVNVLAAEVATSRHTGFEIRR